jgi:murein L,D-transpeptidase YafK
MKILILLILLAQTMFSQDFFNQQLLFPRVGNAFINKRDSIQLLLKNNNIEIENLNVFWRATKWNKKLELFAFDFKLNKYKLIKIYDICAIVGDLGPKRKEGDLQIPEGFYYIKTFNPNSKYHLSLELNYPNESDLVSCDFNKPGGDIYIHGKCETIGCLPMTDQLMEEIYIINLYAKQAGQEYIPVHIYPTKLTVNNFNKLKSDYFKNNIKLLEFWSNLKEHWDYFEKNKTLPYYEINKMNGKYIITSK